VETGGRVENYNEVRGYVPGQTSVSKIIGVMNQGAPKFYSRAKYISVNVSPNVRCL
jgi:hypothetical protein